MLEAVRALVGTTITLPDGPKPTDVALAGINPGGTMLKGTVPAPWIRPEGRTLPKVMVVVEEGEITELTTPVGRTVDAATMLPSDGPVPTTTAPEGIGVPEGMKLMGKVVTPGMMALWPALLSVLVPRTEVTEAADVGTMLRPLGKTLVGATTTAPEWPVPTGIIPDGITLPGGIKLMGTGPRRGMIPETAMLLTTPVFTDEVRGFAGALVVGRVAIVLVPMIELKPDGALLRTEIKGGPPPTMLVPMTDDD